MTAPVEVGRYLLYEAIAAGGMATVHVGRILGPAGFSRLVAIKRLHPHLALDATFAAMFLDEARLASRIQHPNVIGTIDVVYQDQELFLVMDYVRGGPLHQLLQEAEKRPPPSIAVVAAIGIGMLYGLHAAHEARDADGVPLDIVHRDVSPQNILIGRDGVARVVDFGIAKAVSRSQNTREGELKGKLSYMAPEQLGQGRVDRRTDVYGASVVLWEALTRRRLFTADDTAGIVARVLMGDIVPPSTYRTEVSAALDAVVMRGLAKNAADRYPTALEMATALEAAVTPATPREVGEWVEQAGGDSMRARDARIAELERGESATPANRRTGIEGTVLTGTARRELVGAVTAPVDTSLVPAMPTSATSVAESVEKPETERATEPSAARARWMFLLPAAVALIAGVVSFRLGGRHETHPASSAANEVSSPSSAPPTSPSSIMTATASDPPSSATEPAIDATAPSVVDASAPHLVGRGAPPRRSTVRNVERRAAAPTPSITPSCDPPYTIDESGIKRFKRWCQPQ